MYDIWFAQDSQLARSADANQPTLAQRRTDTPCSRLITKPYGGPAVAPWPNNATGTRADIAGVRASNAERASVAREAPATARKPGASRRRHPPTRSTPQLAQRSAFVTL